MRDADVGLTPEEREETPAAIYRRQQQQKCAEEINLKDILCSTNAGKSILSQYEKNSKLENAHRDQLVQLIIENELKTHVDER